MALKDWIKTLGGEYINRDKNILITISSVYRKTVVDIMNAKTLHTKIQKIFIKPKSANIFVKAFMVRN